MLVKSFLNGLTSTVGGQERSLNTGITALAGEVMRFHLATES